jgi:zinc transport system substrate-binding protein
MLFMRETQQGHMSPTRREALAAGAGAAAGALTGCLGGGSSGSPDGYGAFLALSDWADAVGGEQLTFETPVETGEMGHGWTPNSGIVPDLVATEMFVYLDTPEFQWAVDAAGTLSRDYGDEMTIVDALEGLGPRLLPFDGGGDPPEPVDDREFTREELATGEFQLWDARTDRQEGRWHSGRGHWHGGPPDVAVGDEIPLTVVVPHAEDETIAAPLGADERFRAEVRFAAGADESVLDIGSQSGTVTLQGRSTGETELVFEIYDGEELIEDTTAEPAQVSVVAAYSDDRAPDSFDPHAWIDPVLAGEMVGTITDALAEYDPENADRYRENADRYRAELAAVDERLLELVTDAELDVAVFAGHDSYQYIEQRYGFELVTPTGVSPNEEVASSDIVDLVALIEANSIETVLYDPFEAAQPGADLPRLVEALFEDSGAERAEPLSPLSGVTQGWAEKEWGYVEQMKQVNIPSLEAALNPS